MAFQRDKVAAPSGFKRDKPSQPGLLQRAMNYMEESGKNTREAVMNPSQSIPDVLRSTSDFLTFGLNDRLRSLVKGTDYADEKAETLAAGERSGSIDDALNLGTALMQPSAASKVGGNVLKRGLAFGTEGAAQNATEAAVKGEDIADAAGKGFLFGAGGSAAGDFIGNLGKGKPNYKLKDVDAFHAAADKAPQNRRAGKDMRAGSGRLSLIERAANEGQGGFRKLDERLQQPGAQEAGGWGRKDVKTINELATKKRPGLGGFVKGQMQRTGEALTENFPLNVWTGGTPKFLGQVPKGIGAYMSDVKPKTVKTLKQNQLASGGTKGGMLTPERTDELRNLLARAAMFKARNG